MDIKLIPLSRLETDPKGTLSECVDSGQPLVVELPDHRLVSIQTLEPAGDDSLIDELLESSPSFRHSSRNRRLARVGRSRAA